LRAHTVAGASHLAHNVGHAGLVAHEGGQVARLGLIVAGEGLHLAAMTASALAGQETQRPVTGRLELAVTTARGEKVCQTAIDANKAIAPTAQKSSTTRKRQKIDATCGMDSKPAHN
jgi:hypothetical protein